MLGPVRTAIASPPASRKASFGTKRRSVREPSTTGWRPADDPHPASVVNGGTYPVAGGRRLGEPGDRVEPSDASRGAVDPSGVGRDLFAQLAKQLLLERLDPLLRLQDLRLVLLQLRGDVALAVRDRLLALVVVGDEVQVRLRDLDEVAEHLVEPDLHARKSRCALAPCSRARRCSPARPAGSSAARRARGRVRRG